MLRGLGVKKSLGLLTLCALAPGEGDEEGQAFVTLIGREPDPAMAAEVAEQCQRLLHALDDAQHHLAQRLFHSGYRSKPATAIGESADAGQHDPRGIAQAVGVIGDEDAAVGAALACGALKGFGGRAQMDGNASPMGSGHPSPCHRGSGIRPSSPSARYLKTQSAGSGMS